MNDTTAKVGTSHGEATEVGDDVTEVGPNTQSDDAEKAIACGFDDADGAYVEQFNISVGRVMVKDQDENKEIVQWKAKTIENGNSISTVSDSPADAVLGTMEKLSHIVEPR